MKTLVIVAVAFLAVTIALPRVKRQAYQLPDGAEIIVGNIQQTFTCPQATHAGYYADIANECKIFHVCNPVIHADGSSETQQYSFFCGNQTVFNQLTLTCTWPEDAVPCAQAADFFYVNQNIGVPDAPFLTDADVDRANQAIQAVYGQRTRGGK